MKKQKRKSREDVIMDTILEKERGIFELDNSSNKFPTIHWIIAEYILRDFSSPVGYEGLLRDWANTIKRGLDNAIIRLREEKQVPVYKGLGKSKKIVFITTDANYRNALIEDALRTEVLKKKYEGAWKAHHQFKHPQLSSSSLQQKLIEGEADNNEEESQANKE